MNQYEKIALGDLVHHTIFPIFFSVRSLSHYYGGLRRKEARKLTTDLVNCLMDLPRRSSGVTQAGADGFWLDELLMYFVRNPLGLGIGRVFNVLSRQYFGLFAILFF